MWKACALFLHTSIGISVAYRYLLWSSIITCVHIKLSGCENNRKILACAAKNANMEVTLMCASLLKHDIIPHVHVLIIKSYSILQISGTGICWDVRKCCVDEPVWQHCQQASSLWDNWSWDMGTNWYGNVTPYVHSVYWVCDSWM